MGRMYLYAIVLHPQIPLKVTRGMDGSQLSIVAHGEVGAIVGPLTTAFVRPGEDSLWRHGRVIEGLLDGCAVLPMRFGTTVSDASEVRQLLTQRYATLVEALQRLEGRREYTVRVLSSDRLPEARAATLAAEINRTLALSAQDCISQVLTTPRLILTGTYLVDQARMEAFTRQVDSLGAVHPELRLLLSGPSPAYSFVPPLEAEFAPAAERA
jgi:hypothetical protein